MDRMKGMVAIVTGGSRGLGRAIAKEYAREGAKVVISARPRSPTGLPGTIFETAIAIRAEGGEALSVPCDVTDEEQVKGMVHRAMEQYGRIDVLVNNAGLMVLGEPFLDIGPERWDQLMAVNVRGAYLVCRSVVPVMLEQGRGSIISIGSRSALGPTAGDTAYGSSKVALQMFSLCLAEELREPQHRCQCVKPRGNEERRLVGDSLGPARLARAGGAGGGGALRRLSGSAELKDLHRQRGAKDRIRQDLGLLAGYHSLTGPSHEPAKGP